MYTKTGDKGTTGLIGGTRVKKNDLRLDAYGTIDELNSYLGVVRSMQTNELIDGVLEKIQNKLFVIGAHLATDNSAAMIKRQLPVFEADVLLLESEMDSMNRELPELRNFILPGGCQAASFCHVARTVCRRAERIIVELAEKVEIESQLIIYINRLSDYLFVLSRKVSADQNSAEILWVPGLDE